jgi:CheY-like chemotaxis protein
MAAKIQKAKKYNVILAEDNELHQRLIKAFLEKFNVNLEIVNNGKELLEKLEKERKYDLVLMDIQMPVMDGYSATEAIRKNPKYKDLLIIGLTAFAMDGDMQVAISKGMNDYITKPIDEEILFNTLSRYLKLKR